MLTRLKVTGFKNLVDVDISFGPFTCIVGANGAGKSNLFDAIQFLSRLASGTLIEAALADRNGESGTGDLRSIFHRSGDHWDNRMSFDAEMIIPREGVDDLGQPVKSRHTLVRYSLELSYTGSQGNPIQVVWEKLEAINPTEARPALRFPHTKKWRDSTVFGKTRTGFLIYPDRRLKRGVPIIVISKEGEKSLGQMIKAKLMPRTALSWVNTSDYPTVLLTQREMQSWRILHLEPSALHGPDKLEYESERPIPLGAHGAGLARYLYSLDQWFRHKQRSKYPATWIYDQLAGRLRELIGDIDQVRVDHDVSRDLLTLIATDREGTEFPARLLSDGTLRFLALAALDWDATATGLVGVEEPENGIHPARLEAMLRLLQDLAVGVKDPVDEDNILRQVIIATHSPLVVANIPDDSLIWAEARETVQDDRRFPSAHFSFLPDTWRQKAFPHVRPLPKGKVIEYLNQGFYEAPETRAVAARAGRNPRRVAAREDLAPYLPFMSVADE